jgi:iron complex outermembrane receptor protein
MTLLSKPSLRSSVRIALGLIPFAVTAVAQAQGRAGAIEEVIVTAQKRAEDVQDVPIAISAITGDVAAKIGVINGMGLAQVVPGLQMNRQTNGTTGFLRGVGQPSTQAGTEPAVAMYVDDVYMMGANVQIAQFNDIERIEVLKGPQGTLFGRNATGGVIHVITKKPTDEPEFQIKLGYANYNKPSGAIYAAGPLTDGFMASFAAWGEDQQDGWGDNFTTGNETYLQDDYGGRIKLLWEPSDATSVLASFDYDDYYNQQAVYFRPAPLNPTSGRPQTTSNAGAVSIPPPDIYDTFENLDPIASVEQMGGSVKITHDFGPMQFVSISAYRESEAEQLFAQDGANFARLNPNLIYEVETFTQEFQLLSSADSRISWVAGLFYLDDQTDITRFQFSGFLPMVASGFANETSGAESELGTESWSAFVQATLPITDRFNVTGGVRYTKDDRDMSGRTVNFSPDGTRKATEATNSGIDESWDNTTFRLALDYQLTDDVMAYVAWNRGFKSGQFNSIIGPDFLGSVPAARTIDPPVEPEELDAYTIGIKSQFLDDTLQVNAEAFYYEYDNLQLQAVQLIPGGGTTTRLTNAAAATIQGIDIDVTWLPVERLTLRAAVEFLDGEYDDFPNGQFFVYNAAAGGNCAFTPAPPPAPVPCGGAALPPNYDATTGNWNLKGNQTIQSPEFSSSLTAIYSIPLAGGDLDFSLNWYHTDEYFADADNGLGQVFPSSQRNNMQDALDLLNGSITWYAPGDRWSLQLWGRNRTDEEYWSFANETGTVTKNTPAPPLEYGITFTMNFGQ